MIGRNETAHYDMTANVSLLACADLKTATDGGRFILSVSNHGLASVAVLSVREALTLRHAIDAFISEHINNKGL